MTDKLYGAISLARKAGKVTGGFEAVCEAAFGGTAYIVLLARDLSPGTEKKVRAACEGLCDVHKLPLIQDELAPIMHKRFGVLAVTDKDLAALCRKALPDEEEPA